MKALHRSRVDIAQVQLVRKAVLLIAIAGGVAFLVLGGSRWPGGELPHETIEWAGIMLIVFCILGRTWSSLYIAGRKVWRLVTDGPYSVSRNPLYFFSIVGAAGAGAQLGSVMLAFVAGLVAWLVFYLVVQKEERVLMFHYGNVYRQYLATVPRFIPRLSLWRDVEKLEVWPGMVVRTFIDACVFLLAIPLAEGFEFLHDSGLLPVLVSLP